MATFSIIVSSLTNLFFLYLSVIKKIAQYIGEVMEDSKDKVQENLLANGGRFCEYGFLFASENEHVALKHAHIRKDNHQQHF